MAKNRSLIWWLLSLVILSGCKPPALIMPNDAVPEGEVGEYMANLAHLIGTPSIVVGTGSVSYVPSGSVANVIDLNTATGVYSGGAGFVADGWGVEIALEFPSDITQVKIRATRVKTGDAEAVIDVGLEYGGAAHTIGSADYGTNIDTVFNGAWTGVTKIYISAGGASWDDSYTTALYEVYVEGTYAVDSGIRVETSDGTIALAEERTLSSAARYRRGTANKSFMLVDVSSSVASPVRVNTPSGVKAIAEYIA